MIRKFKAATVKQAMSAVKKALGEDAVILQTRKTRSGLVEIHAMSGADRAGLAGAADAPEAGATPGAPPHELAAEVRRLRTAVKQMTEQMPFAGLIRMVEPFRSLIQSKGLDEEVAVDLARRIRFVPESAEPFAAAEVDRALNRALRDYVVVAPSLELPKGRPKIVFFVGPTGIGKTTTTIKLATNPRFYGGKEVGLITVDTYRVAAAAQLKMFSALADLPLEIAYTPEDFRQALQRFRNKQVVLVDTAGRSPLNADHIQKLQQFIAVQAPDEMHLVLSVSMRADNSLDAAKSLGVLPINRLVFSKLDETPRIGNILNVAKKINLPISFLTNGQSIPDDILVASNEFIANSILDT